MSCLIEAGHNVLIHCFSPLCCTFFDDRLWGLSDLFCNDIGAMANIWYDIDNFDYSRYNTTASWWCAWTSRMMMSSLLMISTYLIILCWKQKLQYLLVWFVNRYVWICNFNRSLVATGVQLLHICSTCGFLETCQERFGIWSKKSYLCKLY